MRRLLIIFLLILPLAITAQTRLTGSVVDTKGEPLAGAIVQLRNAANNKMIRFGRTDAKGLFSMEAAADSYMEVSLLGFRKKRRM